jgi:uncharacterized protein YodC (DUF2158 family)
MNYRLNLGDEVKDIVTGYKGIIMYRCHWYHNSDTYGVKSQILKDGIPKQTVTFDDAELVLVKANKVKIENDKTPNFKFKLGDKVKDNLSKFKGIIVSQTQWISNCNHYAIESGEVNSGKIAEREHLSEIQITLVKAAAVPKVKKKRPGGPVGEAKRSNY